ncbi:MAG: alcohol dehydrogenase catalytic domain-containing protein [Oscillospiraceae bacterium]|nr:alcohol dehydrogenase catalytic domain-containing protein [Oscillospiraceae bacterium]
MDKNYALVIRRPGDIALEERPMPVPGPGEVLIQVRYVALCGSDGKLYAGTYTAPHHYPIILGHEWIGQVLACGRGVDDLETGDYVTGDCSLYCGKCPACALNRNHCEVIEKRGITVDGGCANYITVKRRHIYKCPCGEADCKPFVLTEPTAVTANGILKRVPNSFLNRVERAAILGAGGIGLLSMLSLSEFPIREIVMVDMAENKLEMVKRFGLDNVTTCNSTDALEGSFDLVVEAAGATPTLQACSRIAAPAGHIVLLGHQHEANVDFGEIVKKSLTIHASNGSTGGFIKAMQIIEGHPDLISMLITDTIPLRAAADYIAQGKHLVNNIKVVIDMMA